MPDAAVVAQWILALGLGMIIVELIRVIAGKKEKAANTTVTISNNALEWSKHALERAKAAEERVDKAVAQSQHAETRSARCRARQRELEMHIERLEDIMRASGLRPPPMPKEDPEDEQ